MKAPLLFSLAASLAASQSSLGAIPKCAQDCTTKYVTGNGIAGCKAGDVVCVCSNDQFLSSIACCVAGTCDEADQEKTANYAMQLCRAAGVTVPDKVECTSTSAAASGTASASATSSSSGSNSAGSAASTPATSTAAAAPAAAGSVGGLAGAVLALLAAF